MAIIYDLSTGKVISEHEAIEYTSKSRDETRSYTRLQSSPETEGHQEHSNPCDAYMVLLQRLLRDL